METFEVRDRRGGFLWVSNQIFDYFASQVNSSTFMLYMALCRMANNETQECFPSQARLGKMIGVDERTVRRCMDELLEMKLVGTEKVGRAYRYTLLKTPDNLSAIPNPDTGHQRPLIPDISNKNTGHRCPTNKTKEQDYIEQDLILSPSEEKEPSRFSTFKEIIFLFYGSRWGRKPAWDGSEANQLSNLLKADPDLDASTFAQWLKNYGNSKDISPGERPRAFLAKIHKYSVAPLNQYGRDENVGKESLAERNANAFASVFGGDLTAGSASLLEGNESGGHQSLARVSERPFVTGD